MISKNQFKNFQSITLYCCYCGNRISATNNLNMRFKGRCANCGSCIIVTKLGRRHQNLDVFAPKEIIT